MKHEFWPTHRAKRKARRKNPKARAKAEADRAFLARNHEKKETGHDSR